jgi:hypothetical protein
MVCYYEEGQRTLFTHESDLEGSCTVDSLVLLPVFLAKDVELNASKSDSGLADSLYPFRGG